MNGKHVKKEVKLRNHVGRGGELKEEEEKESEEEAGGWEHRRQVCPEVTAGPAPSRGHAPPRRRLRRLTARKSGGCRARRGGGRGAGRSCGSLGLSRPPARPHAAPRLTPEIHGPPVTRPPPVAVEVVVVRARGGCPWRRPGGAARAPRGGPFCTSWWSAFTTRRAAR